MKKRVALLLAGAMTLSAVMPSTAFAASKNSVTNTYSSLPKKTMFVQKAKNVQDGDATIEGMRDVKYMVRGTDLTIEVQDEITENGSFEIELSNGEFYYGKADSSGEKQKLEDDLTFDKEWFKDFAGSNYDHRDYGTTAYSKLTHKGADDSTGLPFALASDSEMTEEEKEAINKAKEVLVEKQMELLEVEMTSDLKKIVADAINTIAEGAVEVPEALGEEASQEDKDANALAIAAAKDTNKKVAQDINTAVTAVKGLALAIDETKESTVAEVKKAVFDLFETADPTKAKAAALATAVETILEDTFGEDVLKASTKITKEDAATINTNVNAAIKAVTDATTAISDVTNIGDKTALLAEIKVSVDDVKAVAADVAEAKKDVQDQKDKIEEMIKDAEAQKPQKPNVGIHKPSLPYTIEVDRNRSKALVRYTLTEAGAAQKGEKGYRKTDRFVIPLAFITQEDKEVTVGVATDRGQSVVTPRNIGIATFTSGATTSKFASIKEGRDEITLDTLAIRENRLNVIKEGWTRITAPAGYYFANDVKSGTKNQLVTDGSTKNGIKVSGIYSTNLGAVEAYYPTHDYSKVGYRTEILLYTDIAQSGTSAIASGMYVEGLTIRPEDDDMAFDKDLYVDVRGVKPSSNDLVKEDVTTSNRDSSMVSSERVKAAKRVDWVVSVKAEEKLPTYRSGQRGLESAKFTISERTPGAWLSQRETKLTLVDEEGEVLKNAKIGGIKFTSKNFGSDVDSSKFSSQDREYLHYRKYRDADKKEVIAAEDSGNHTNGNVRVEFAKNASSVSFSRMDIESGKKGEIEVELLLSLAAGFDGPVYVQVDGRAVEGKITPVKIANAYVPVTVKTKPTDIQIGYTNYKVASIEITETEAGRLERGETITAGIAGGFSAKDQGDYKAIALRAGTRTISGDDVFAMDGNTVKRESEKPVTLTYANPQVDIDRTVPYGSYDLRIAGSAIVTNNNDQDHDGFYKHGLDVKYLNVVTDGANRPMKNNVKVKQNSSEVLINDKAEDLGAPTYISGGSMMVPVRFVALALDLPEENIHWDANLNKAVIRTSERVVVFEAGSEFIMIDGIQQTMVDPAGAIIKTEINPDNERMYIPFRQLANAFGIPVTWHEDTSVAEYNPQKDVDQAK